MVIENTSSCIKLKICKYNFNDADIIHMFYGIFNSCRMNSLTKGTFGVSKQVIIKFENSLTQNSSTSYICSLYLFTLRLQFLCLLFVRST